MTFARAPFQEALLSAADAAKILDLSPDMVRLLAREGRLPAAVRTVRGGRLFRRGDVEQLAAERAGEGGPVHTVQFYEDDDFLSATVSIFLADALRAGAPAIAIATEAHRRTFGERLAVDDIDIEQACACGQLTLLDAEQTLAKFMRGGTPDRRRFRAEIGRVIEAAGATRPRARLRAYGEMVDVLCRQGDMPAALTLEGLWNELAQDHSFTLLCTYALAAFNRGEHTEAFERICSSHTRVLPAERFLTEESQDGRFRQVALLQQRALSLDTQVQVRDVRECDARAEPCQAEESRSARGIGASR